MPRGAYKGGTQPTKLVVVGAKHKQWLVDVLQLESAHTTACDAVTEHVKVGVTDLEIVLHINDHFLEVHRRTQTHDSGDSGTCTGHFMTGDKPLSPL